jgi:hypothetical protein
LKYGHTKTGLKRNNLPISFTTLNSSLPNKVAPVTMVRREEANRDRVNPELVWAQLRLTRNIL